MYRKLHTALVILMSLLFAVSVIAWVRSYFYADQLSREFMQTNKEKRNCTVVTEAIGSRLGGIYLASRVSLEYTYIIETPDKDHLSYSVASFELNDPRGEALKYEAWVSGNRRVNNTPDWRRMGFNWTDIRAGDRFVVVPYWIVVLMLGSYPCIRAIRFGRLQYCARRDLCRVCGYDLRASPERCPECGTARSLL